MSGIVVLLSGGLDSAVVLAEAARTGKLCGTVFVDYGQPALLPEWKAALLLSAHYRTECMVVRITGDVTLGDTMRLGVGLTGSRVLPGRNTLLLAAALGWTLRLNADALWWGPTATDQQDYLDCRPEFLRGMGAVCALHGVGLEAPLIAMLKSDVWRLAKELAVPTDLTWSCYEPSGDQPCGRCNACRDRQHAMQQGA